MSGRKHLLLLAGYVLLARCQQNPTVSMSPKLSDIFTGDLFYLSCDNSGDKVTWYIDDTLKTLINKTWKIAVASPNDSGNYQCESNGKRSNTITINVLEYIPSASLTMETGNPVMQTGASVILRLDNEDGLYSWRCWVYVRERKKILKIMFKLENNASVVFQTMPLTAPESIYWCTDKSQKIRSNQIIVRASDRAVSLEMYPLPAVIGEPLILRCLVWGTDQISKVAFYKDNNPILNTVGPVHEIRDVNESIQGSYKCDATYTHEAYTDKKNYHHDSESQDVFVQVPPIKAVLSLNSGLSCSCPRCPNITNYHWYHKKDGQQWTPMNINSNNMTPKESGSYACRAVWNNKRSFLSNPYVYSQNTTTLVVFVVLAVLVVMLGVAVCVCYKCYKRTSTGPLYEDVGIRLREKGDENYEVLQGAQRGAEYDTLHPEAQRRERKEGMKDGVHQTVGMGGAAGGEGGEGGYEALKKGEMKGGEYQTLGKEGAGGGEGGYEALKKEGMKGGEYQTLGKEGAGGGEGGYEALKKEGMKGGEYQTLGKEGAGGGEGGYEALKKEGMKGGEYQTLGIGRAGGGMKQ